MLVHQRVYFSIQLGTSSSQLTNSVHHFLEGWSQQAPTRLSPVVEASEASGASSLHRPQKVSPFPSQGLQGFAFLRGKSEAPTH